MTHMRFLAEVSVFHIILSIHRKILKVVSSFDHFDLDSTFVQAKKNKSRIIIPYIANQQTLTFIKLFFNIIYELWSITI